MFTIQYVVERQRITDYGHEPRGYCRSQEDYQYLIRKIKVLGVTIWKNRVDQEIIPNHVVISMGCYGDSNGWVSKFAPAISAQENNHPLNTMEACYV